MTSYHELMDNALQAKQSREWSASNRALELLGKELGICTSRDIPWDGDLASLLIENAPHALLRPSLSCRGISNQG